jgi:peptidoglycan hydrolase-like protein with peptidoglycan-binding domain
MKINYQKIILMIFIIFLIVAGVIWFFVFLNQEETVDDPQRDENLFPFGEILPGSGFGSGVNQGTTGDGTLTEGGEIGGIVEPVIDDTPQLQLIFNEPTGGFTPINRIEEEEVVTDQISQEGVVSQLVETIEVENHFVRYSAIEDGSVFETRLTGPGAFFQELIVDNFIPNAEHSIFSPDGEHVAFQYWDNDNRNIETYLGDIDLLSLDVEPCPYDFNGSIELEQESDTVLAVHQFLNRDSRTIVSQAGINSPGNESNFASEATFAAITRFQELNGLEADGKIGPQTRGEMIRVCNEQQEELAQEKLEELDTKYEISGFFLPQNIISVSMDPQSQEVFYLEEDVSGIVGTLRNLEEQTRRTIFTSPHRGWTSSWGSDDSIEITTKPSFASLGYSYNLQKEDGDYNKSFKERNGLTVLPSNDGEKILVHDIRDNRPALSIYERSSNRFLPLSIESFTDKCVWSSTDSFIYCAVPDALAYGNQYPDTWYQGKESYRDSLWRINTETLQEELLSNISVDFGEDIDVEKIDVDDSDQYLYFIDKNSEFLWSYRIEAI